jgi:hypothetical protein
MFPLIEESQISGLSVGNQAQILYRCVKRAVLKPRFRRALLTEPLEKTPGTATEVVRIDRPDFSDGGERLLQSMFQSHVMQIDNGLGKA